jgi:hypothetical protein
MLSKYLDRAIISGDMDAHGFSPCKLFLGQWTHTYIHLDVGGEGALFLILCISCWQVITCGPCGVLMQNLRKGIYIAK